jgi:hypothetical protein
VQHATISHYLIVSLCRKLARKIMADFNYLDPV